MPARLVVLNGEKAGTAHPVQRKERTSIGRKGSNTVVLSGDQISRLHAEIYFEDGHWVLLDRTSVNGTYLNGARIKKAAILEDGQIIRVGNVELEFSDDPSSNVPASVQPHSPAPLADQPSARLLDSKLSSDYVHALSRFMADAVVGTDSTALIRGALETIMTQTRAALAGFLSQDETGDVLPQIVLPEGATVDKVLSRQLSLHAVREKRLIWLSREKEFATSESLASYHDALCVALAGAWGPLGVLHVYHQDRQFGHQDGPFCEILGQHLASVLNLQRLHKQLEAENIRLRMHTPMPDDFVGDSPALQALRARVAKVASQSAIVLIRGETGVGKELVARSLHRQSIRRTGPLVSMNCAAIAKELMESQLFGHVVGAFTGAVADHDGFIRRAEGGILFMDEIGELSPECQAKFLRVLDGYGFTPLGDTKEVHPNVRFLAATNRELEQEVRDGSFRKDLYFRLQRVVIDVPPLREHLEDVPKLVDHYLKHRLNETGRRYTVTPAALARLQSYRWPGNVRQLQGVLDNALTSTQGRTIDVQHLVFCDEHLAEPSRLPPSLRLSEVERWAIERALENGGDETTAAEILGITLQELQEKARQHGIPDHSP